MGASSGGIAQAATLVGVVTAGSMVLGLVRGHGRRRGVRGGGGARRLPGRPGADEPRAGAAGRRGREVGRAGPCPGCCRGRDAPRRPDGVRRPVRHGRRPWAGVRRHVAGRGRRRHGGRSRLRRRTADARRRPHPGRARRHGARGRDEPARRRGAGAPPVLLGGVPGGPLQPGDDRRRGRLGTPQRRGGAGVGLRARIGGSTGLPAGPPAGDRAAAAAQPRARQRRRPGDRRARPAPPAGQCRDQRQHPGRPGRRFGAREGVITALSYGWRVVGLAEALLVASLVTALYPAMGTAAGEGADRLRDLVQRSLAAVLVVLVPVTAVLLVAAAPLVALLFGRGDFDPAAVDSPPRPWSGTRRRCWRSPGARSSSARRTRPATPAARCGRRSWPWSSTSSATSPSAASTAWRDWRCRPPCRSSSPPAWPPACSAAATPPSPYVGWSRSCSVREWPERARPRPVGGSWSRYRRSWAPERPSARDRQRWSWWGRPVPLRWPRSSGCWQGYGRPSCGEGRRVLRRVLRRR
jgi:Lipid II flippase MurJ